MAGDKINLAGKFRKGHFQKKKKTKGEKEKKKKGPRKKLTMGLLKYLKSCLCTLVDGAQGQGLRFLEVITF